MSRPVIRVVAAVIERDGKILIGQRRKTDSHGLKWEFPGGKVERGESPAAALARELHVKPPTVSQWRAGSKKPEAIKLLQMQDLAAKDDKSQQ